MERSHFLDSLYPNGYPFKDCILSEVSLLWDGPSIRISLHAREMPLDVPKKWDKSYNRVRIVLEFFVVTDIAFKKWGRQNHLSLVIETEGNLIQVKAQGDDCDLSFSCTHVYFKEISPYLVIGNQDFPMDPTSLFTE